MLFRWLKQRRRQKLLAEPAPPLWNDILSERLTIYPYLDLHEQSKALNIARVMIAEKSWEGCKGLEATDEMRVLVAFQAALLVLGHDDAYFDNVQTILIYPEAFRAPGHHAIGPDTALEVEEERLGEAHHHGPVILSWADICEDIATPGHGRNLVFHEFTHQLDMQNGEVDGVPLLPRPLRKRWQHVMAREFEALCKAVERGRDTFLDPYGATDEAEFFAVITEAFFDQPLELRDQHRKAYDLLREYYRVEPTKWFERMGKCGFTE